MKIKKIAVPLTVLLSLSAGSVWAQPDANDGPPIGGPNPPNAAGGQGGRGPRGNFNDMTPEQRAQMQQQMQQRREADLRRMLIAAKVTDQAVQNAVVDFVNADETARQILQDKARAVRAGLRNDALTNTQVAALLADFRAAVAAEKARRAASSKELAEDLDLAENPRLDALLTLGGVIGDEASVLNGGGGGRGGMGGGFGGGQGGPGGGQGGGQGGRNRGNRNNN